jgi:hypothetical protein
VQSWQYAHTLASLLDEGAYLLKGFFCIWQVLALSGLRFLDQSHAIGFLYSRVIQAIFGPGLRSGRYFALVVGIFWFWGLVIGAKAWRQVVGCAGSLDFGNKPN